MNSRETHEWRRSGSVWTGVVTMAVVDHGRQVIVQAEIAAARLTVPVALRYQLVATIPAASLITLKCREVLPTRARIPTPPHGILRQPRGARRAQSPYSTRAPFCPESGGSTCDLEPAPRGSVSHQRVAVISSEGEATLRTPTCPAFTTASPIAGRTYPT